MTMRALENIPVNNAAFQEHTESIEELTAWTPLTSSSATET